MGVFDFGSDTHDRNKEHYNNVYERPPHEAKFSHEAIAGGAAFAAMHAYEKKQESEGHEVNHAFAKKLLVGIAAAEVDKLVETKGLDFVDRQKAKHEAKQQAEHMYDTQYGGREEGGYYN